MQRPSRSTGMATSVRTPARCSLRAQATGLAGHVVADRRHPGQQGACRACPGRARPMTGSGPSSPSLSQKPDTRARPVAFALPDLEAAHDRRVQRRQQRHHVVPAVVAGAGQRKAAVDADLLRAVAAQEARALAQVGDEHRQPAVPGPARQAGAAPESGAPRQELEGLGGAAVVAVGQQPCPSIRPGSLRHSSIAPAWSSPSPKKTTSTAFRYSPAKIGQRQRAGQALGMGGGRALEIRALELLEQQRVALLPGLAGQALAAAEAQLAAEHGEARGLAVQAAAVLELAAVVAGHPVLDRLDEGLDRGTFVLRTPGFALRAAVRAHAAAFSTCPWRVYRKSSTSLRHCT